VFEGSCVRVTMLKEKEVGHSNDCLRAREWNVRVPLVTDRGVCYRNTLSGLFKYICHYMLSHVALPT